MVLRPCAMRASTVASAVVSLSMQRSRGLLVNRGLSAAARACRVGRTRGVGCPCCRAFGLATLPFQIEAHGSRAMARPLGRSALQAVLALLLTVLVLPAAFAVEERISERLFLIRDKPGTATQFQMIVRAGC